MLNILTKAGKVARIGGLIANAVIIISDLTGLIAGRKLCAESSKKVLSEDGKQAKAAI